MAKNIFKSIWHLIEEPVFCGDEVFRYGICLFPQETIEQGMREWIESDAEDDFWVFECIATYLNDACDVELETMRYIVELHNKSIKEGE